MLLDDWTPITEHNSQILVDLNKTITDVEYFNSVVTQQNKNMMFKIIDSDIVVISVKFMMGRYTAVQYSNTEISDSTYNLLSESGITLRGRNINGVRDQFGREYTYSTNDYLKMHGKRYKKIRSFLNNLKEEITYKTGYNPEMDFLVKSWSKQNKSTHQIKLLETIKKNQELVTIVTSYYGDKIIGFSVTERINENNVIAIQRIINPQIKDIVKEPNFILHYFDCLLNPNTTINLGASRNHEIDIAKRKLIPIDKLTIFRKKSEKVITKEEFNKLKKK